MPVFNTPKNFLEQSLESIYAQTVTDFELVIVDNGSTNIETKKTLESYKNKKNCNIYHCERKSNKRNISVALNYGLKNCFYEYVARMDSDDLMYPDRLEKQLNYMLMNPNVDICGTQIKNMLTNQQSRHKTIITKDEYLYTDWFLNHPTVMFKKSKILNLGAYEEDIEYAPEDLLLWIKALKSGYIIHNLQEVLLDYRLHDNNASQKDSKNKQWQEIVQKAKLG